MNINFYLKPGKFTNFDNNKISETIKLFNCSGLGVVIEILSWLHKNIKSKNDSEFKNKFFRKRTASEIIESGFASGCTDYALVFIVLSRAKGIPTKYIETINTSWLESSSPNFLEGHVFSEVYFDNHWYIVDPEGASIRPWYGKRFKVLSEGLDFSDIGMNNPEDLRKSFEEFKKRKNSK